MPPLVTIKFVRKPFAVEAIQITPQNMRDVSRWCHGQIRTGDTSLFGAPGAPKTGTKVKFIKVPVKRPLSERQTMAQVGDWVVTQGSGHKVYTDKAFKASFERYVEETTDEQETPEEGDEGKPVLDTISVVPSDLFEASQPRSA